MSIFDESVALLETPWSAPVEDLYQAFKARLVAELGLGIIVTGSSEFEVTDCYVGAKPPLLAP